MSASTYCLTFEGAMTERGFWLYVWRVHPPTIVNYCMSE